MVAIGKTIYFLVAVAFFSLVIVAGLKQQDSKKDETPEDEIMLRGDQQ